MAETEVLRAPKGIHSWELLKDFTALCRTDLFACQMISKNVSMTNIHVNGGQASIIEHKLQLLRFDHKKIQI